MKVIKNIKLGLLWVFVIFVLCSCISVFAQPLTGDLPTPRLVKDRPFKIAYVTKGFESEATQRCYEHFKIECAYRGWELHEVTAPLEKTADAVRVLIEKDVDAIACNYSYFDYWMEEVMQARKKGIGIYALDTELKPGVIVSTRIYDASAGGKLMAELINAAHGTGYVGILAYHMHEGVDRRNAAAEALARWYEKKEIKVVYQDITYPGYDSQAYNIASTWADKYGKEMKAIFGGFDTPAVFAAGAFEAKGFTSKDIICGGINGGRDALGAIRSPENPFKITISQPFELFTHATCEVINMIQLEGIPIEEALKQIGADPVTGNCFMDGFLIKPENTPPAGSTYYEVHGWYGEDPEDPHAWINWWKEANLEPYRS